MSKDRENGVEASSSPSHAETFVWRNGGGGGAWTIRHWKSSRIYDSDPHSLAERSHNAWKKELHLTRFANQELPEALWGDNFLELAYTAPTTTTTHGENSHHHRTSGKTGKKGLRISVCALEALRAWAVMDMELEREETKKEQSPAKNSPPPKSRNTKPPTIIPHKSGRKPDAWDYTYTTNYSGSVECFEQHDCSNAKDDGGLFSFRAKQPDQSTLYAIRVVAAPTNESLSFSESSLSHGIPTTPLKAVPAAELRPPMCQCIGGRMICAGVAQTLRAAAVPPPSKNKAPSGLPKIRLPQSPTFRGATTSSSTSTKNASASMPPRQRALLPSPEWMPHCPETDGPFDMDRLLHSQRTPPLHYTGTIPFWIQNLDPQSYSFLTATAVVCDDGNSNGNGGFLAVLLRCFVRVNGVRVRLVDTKFLVRRRKCPRTNRTRTVVLRERSWKEGTWQDYTGGSDPSYRCLGSDLEQGRRASRMLPDLFPPVVDKLEVWEDDCAGDSSNDHDRNDGPHEQLSGLNENGHSDGKPQNGATNRDLFSQAWRIPSANGGCLASCAVGGMPFLVLASGERKLVALNARSGRRLWEQTVGAEPSSILSLAAEPFRDGDDSSLSRPTKARVVVGDDSGGVHVLGWDEEDIEPDGNAKPAVVTEVQFHSFDSSSNSGSRTTRNVQRPSHWVENVVWSPSGNYYAAAAGKKIMINGSIVEMEGTVYDLAFLPPTFHQRIASETGHGRGSDSNSDPIPELLMVALYGGLTIVDAATASVWHRRFPVGSSAVLSFALSPNGQFIGIGCLDKRLRVFETTPASTDGDDERNGIKGFADGFGIPGGCWEARDWIGFDGGVTRVAFSPDNQRLAALGRSIILVVDHRSEWGEAPTICSLMHYDRGGNSERMGSEERFQSIAWSAPNLLVASTECYLYIFDARATIDTVPKRLYPIDSIPIEKGFHVVDTNGGIILWGDSGIRKINILHNDCSK